MLRYEAVAPGLPYHIATVPVPAESPGRPPPHSHADFHELMYVTAGTGEQRIGAHVMPLRRGDLILIRPQDVHDFTGLGRAGMRFVNVAFPTRDWRAFADLVGISFAADWDTARLPVLAHDVELEADFDQLRGTSGERGRALDLVRLWTAVLPPLEAAMGTTADARPPWLVSARSGMVREDALREGLPCLLRRARVSHGHLARSMMAHYGQTPVQFLTERRVAHAATLLATTVESIGTVAERTGFASQSYFARVFALHRGCSPRDHRERARQRRTHCDGEPGHLS